jgi:ABC-2 type transport system permease protein
VNLPRLRRRDDAAGAPAGPAPDAVPHRAGDRLFPNGMIVAQREYTQRVRTRAFLFGSLLLMAVALAAALIPVITRVMDQQLATKVAVYAADAGLSFDPVALIRNSLNGVGGGSGVAADPSPGSSAPSPSPSGTGGPFTYYVVSPVSDLARARADLLAGKYDGLLVVSRTSAGDVSFEFATDATPGGRIATYMGQAVTAIALKDRLERLSISTEGQARLFAPLLFDIVPREPGAPPEQSATDEVSRSLTGNLLVILIFITVITYGTWVATSVAEEKSSRVMELMLSAASPRQMLFGKVVGNGGAGLTQYLGILGAGLVGILLQGPLTALLVPGATSDGASLAGLTPGVLLVFVVFFILAFALYSLVYAAAGSLVSRQEDVQQIVTPLTFLSMAGYLAAIVGASAATAGWVVFLSYFPFTSPYVMLVRVIDGSVQPWEPLIAVAILVVTIALMLVVAARVYSAGVLLYGQRPTLRALISAARIGR